MPPATTAFENLHIKTSFDSIAGGAHSSERRTSSEAENLSIAPRAAEQQQISSSTDSQQMGALPQNNTTHQSTSPVPPRLTNGHAIRNPMEKDASLVLIQTHHNQRSMEIVKNVTGTPITEGFRYHGASAFGRRSSVTNVEQPPTTKAFLPSGASSPISSQQAKSPIISMTSPSNGHERHQYSPQRTISPVSPNQQLSPSQQPSSPAAPTTILHAQTEQDSFRQSGANGDRRNSVPYSSNASFVDDSEFLQNHQQLLMEDVDLHIHYHPRISIQTLVLLFSALFFTLILLYFIWNLFFVSFICISQVYGPFQRVLDTFVIQGVHALLSTGVGLFLIATLLLHVSLTLKLRTLLRSLGENMLCVLDIRFESVKTKKKTSWMTEVAVIEHAFFQLAQLMSDWKGLLPQHFFLDVASEHHGGDNIVRKLLDYDNFVKYLSPEEAQDFSDVSSMGGVGTSTAAPNNMDNMSRIASTSTIGKLVKQSSQASSINSATSRKKQDTPSAQRTWRASILFSKALSIAI
uniref:Uncharacterized protein n=1 Tax=Percolomonas cosmopolitus TaxID=63605 RepID=A0A7S1KQG7_9EUKA|mmetsp:Transcript_4831/g.18051  ORF Transcript_4831/g.18051 Transcript_4831/m.18051 type:complete len:520 (+) Transcript_4831:270-1829(+)